MGNPGRQEILVVLERQADQVDVGALTHEAAHVSVRQQVQQQIAAGGTASVHGDRAVEPGGVVAGILES